MEGCRDEFGRVQLFVNGIIHYHRGAADGTVKPVARGWIERNRDYADSDVERQHGHRFVQRLFRFLIDSGPCSQSKQRELLTWNTRTGHYLLLVSCRDECRGKRLVADVVVHDG